MVSEERVYQRNIQNIFEITLKTIESLNWEIATFNYTNGVIKAETNMSFLSWGENIEIRIRQLEDEINVRVDSESRAQIIDWGKNAENISKFFSVLERLM